MISDYYTVLSTDCNEMSRLSSLFECDPTADAKAIMKATQIAVSRHCTLSCATLLTSCSLGTVYGVRETQVRSCRGQAVRTLSLTRYNTLQLFSTSRASVAVPWYLLYTVTPNPYPHPYIDSILTLIVQSTVDETITHQFLQTAYTRLYRTHACSCT